MKNVGNAAERIVEARTTLQRKFLHFFNVFGDGERSFSEDFKRIFQAKGLEIDQNHPMLDRYVTLGYIALVEMDSVTPNVGSFDDDIAWHPVNDLPAMVGDHQQIIRNAQEYLVGLNEFSPVGQSPAAGILYHASAAQTESNDYRQGSRPQSLPEENACFGHLQTPRRNHYLGKGTESVSLFL